MSKQDTCKLQVNGKPCQQLAYREGYCQKHWPHKAFVLASLAASIKHQLEYGNPGTGTTRRYAFMEEIYRNLTGEELSAYNNRSEEGDI